MYVGIHLTAPVLATVSAEQATALAERLDAALKHRAITHIYGDYELTVALLQPGSDTFAVARQGLANAAERPLLDVYLYGVETEVYCPAANACLAEQLAESIDTGDYRLTTFVDDDDEEHDAIDGEWIADTLTFATATQEPQP